MPPGMVAPFVVRFDAGSVPFGNLVFSSETRPLGEIQDLALFKVRRSSPPCRAYPLRRRWHVCRYHLAGNARRRRVYSTRRSSGHDHRENLHDPRQGWDH
jgi:hypothetical protein